MSVVLPAVNKSKYLLVKNIGINLFTKMLPILVGVVTLPMLVHGLGVERTGILQIIWSLIGYSSFFDLGLGRALTQLVSRKLAANEDSELPSIIMTALIGILLLGLIPMLGLVFGASYLTTFLHVTPGLIGEAKSSIFWLALSIPAMLLITCQTGVLQSYQKFDWITWLNMPAIIGNFIAPVLMLQFTQDLGQIVAVMVLCRLIMASLFFIALNRCVEALWSRCRFQIQLIKPLFHFGKWVTVSNIVSPLMVYLMDRLFLANLFSVRMASYYVVPYGVLQKMTVAPWAIMGVMFPAFSASFYKDRSKSARYYYKSLILTAVLLFLPVLVVVLFAKSLLTAWMGADFAMNSYRLTQMIAIALYVYSINLVPSSLIQAAGESSFTAKLQLVELPIFLISMYLSIKTFGIIGAPAVLLSLFLLEGAILQWRSFYLLKGYGATSDLPSLSLSIS